MLSYDAWSQGFFNQEWIVDLSFTLCETLADSCVCDDVLNLAFTNESDIVIDVEVLSRLVGYHVRRLNSFNHIPVSIPRFHLLGCLRNVQIFQSLKLGVHLESALQRVQILQRYGLVLWFLFFIKRALCSEAPSDFLLLGLQGELVFELFLESALAKEVLAFIDHLLFDHLPVLLCDQITVRARVVFVIQVFFIIDRSDVSQQLLVSLAKHVQRECELRGLGQSHSVLDYKLLGVSNALLIGRCLKCNRALDVFSHQFIAEQNFLVDNAQTHKTIN